MKKFCKTLLAAGLFVALISFDIRAMNENLKRKDNFEIFEIEEKNEISKKRKLEDIHENIQKAFPNGFPDMLDYDSKKKLEPLWPKDLMETDFYKKLSMKNQDEKNELIKDSVNMKSSTSEFDRDRNLEHQTFTVPQNYSKKRFEAACALLAGANLDDLYIVKMIETYRYGGNNLKEIHYFASYYFRFLCNTIDLNDYWLIYIALLCGANPTITNIDPNIGTEYEGEYAKEKYTILQHARTVEMAKLLLIGGAEITYDDYFLDDLVKLGHGELLEFYLKEHYRWKLRTPDFNYLLDRFVQQFFIYRKNDAFYKYLKVLKVLFLAGYRNNNLNKTKEQQNRWNNVSNDLRSFLFKIFANHHFSLDLYFYNLDRKKENALWDEQRKMYDFGKYNNQTDVNIEYLWHI